MSAGQFDENDTCSWFFPTITHDEVQSLLSEEETGTFLVRDSVRFPGTYVISVKEVNEVAHYPVKTVHKDGRTELKIRDDWTFADMPSLLSFYKLNMFRTTALIKPAGSVTTRNHANGSRIDMQRYSENLSATSSRLGICRPSRVSAPANYGARISRDESGQMFVKVIKSRNPSAYVKNFLTLKVGDVIKVLRRSGDNWEGELNGEIGQFPFTCVEFIEPPAQKLS